MSELKVGDVCFELSRLAAGMTVRWESSTREERASKLVERDHEGHWVDDDGCVFRHWFVKKHGVTILALPEKAPVTITGGEKANPVSLSHVQHATKGQIIFGGPGVPEEAGPGGFVYFAIDRSLAVPMPPARCAPGCEPARACRIVIPVTDKGTRYECPAFVEKMIASAQDCIDRGRWTSDRWNRAVAESRAMRDQEWEPRSPMIGRYRFDRRPR